MLQGSPLDLWHEPEFTDQEIMTIYLYTMCHEGHTKVKHIYRFASDWLRPWFPPRGCLWQKLGSYQAFAKGIPSDNNRLNRLGGAFANPKDSFGKASPRITDWLKCCLQISSLMIACLTKVCAEGIPSDWTPCQS